MDTQVGRWIRTGPGRPGRTQKLLECVCGAQFWVYLWSMAGHGGAPCKSCGGVILYQGLYYVSRTDYEAWRKRRTTQGGKGD